MARPGGADSALSTQHAALSTFRHGTGRRWLDEVAPGRLHAQSAQSIRCKHHYPVVKRYHNRFWSCFSRFESWPGSFKARIKGLRAGSLEQHDDSPRRRIQSRPGGQCPSVRLGQSHASRAIQPRRHRRGHGGAGHGGHRGRARGQGRLGREAPDGGRLPERRLRPLEGARSRFARLGRPQNGRRIRCQHSRGCRELRFRPRHGPDAQPSGTSQPQ